MKIVIEEYLAARYELLPNIPRTEETSDLNDPVYDDPRCRHDVEQFQTLATSANLLSQSYSLTVPPLFPRLSDGHEDEFQTVNFQVAVDEYLGWFKREHGQFESGFQCAC